MLTPAVTVQAATATHLADSNTTCARVAHNAKGVLVIGDSITANGFGDIKKRLAVLGHPSCINARVGRPTAEGVEVLRQYIRTTRIPHTVILALGTNDTLDVAAMPKLVRAAMFAAGASTKVIWVNAFNAQSTRAVEARAQTRQINRTLWQADHSYWNLAVVDWSGYITPRAYYLLQSDGVHPTGLGNQVRTTLMLNGMLHLWTRTGHQVMPRP
jgi:lysophospholipase L1-like esterase